MIEKLAEFMGWETHEYKGIEKVTLSVPDGKYHFRLHDSIDWNLWMLVEERLREKGLWDDYCLELFQVVNNNRYKVDGNVFRVMAATKQQRMEAAVTVIKEVDDVQKR